VGARPAGKAGPAEGEFDSKESASVLSGAVGVSATMTNPLAATRGGAQKGAGAAAPAARTVRDGKEAGTGAKGDKGGAAAAAETPLHRALRLLDENVSLQKTHRLAYLASND